MNLNLQHTIATPQPTLVFSGQCGYRITGERIIINIDEIANQRDSGNLSGTLAIELWALEKPYNGGEFSGVALAATSIGELSGQHCLRNCHYDLVFNPPATGTWQLVLMLREWEHGAFVTRDQVNFQVAYEVGEIHEVANPEKAADSSPQVTRGAKDNVVTVDFGEPSAAVQSAGVDAAASAENIGNKPAVNIKTKPAANIKAKPQAGRKTTPSANRETKPSANGAAAIALETAVTPPRQIESSAAVDAVANPQSGKISSASMQAGKKSKSAALKAAAKNASVANLPVDKTSKKNASANNVLVNNTSMNTVSVGTASEGTASEGTESKDTASSIKVSINTASAKQLHQIKGLSGKLAQRIVDKRPFRSLEDLLDVKGMGKKLLKQLADKISL